MILSCWIISCPLAFVASEMQATCAGLANLSVLGSIQLADALTSAVSSLEGHGKTGRDNCGKGWRSIMTETTLEKMHNEKQSETHMYYPALSATRVNSRCGLKGAASWIRCCSARPGEPRDDHRLQGRVFPEPDIIESPCPSKDTLCCAIGFSRQSELVLPALVEISFNVWLRKASWRPLSFHTAETGRVVSVIQSGFLRPFDVAAVLWPAGYLLAQAVADPSTCSRWAPNAKILELGTGVGLPAIAAALCTGSRAHVVATDHAWHSLVLTRENARRNNVEVETIHVDWKNDTDLDSLGSKFDVVLGSALMFESWEHTMWEKLASLLADDGRAFISHSEGLVIPDTVFRIIQKKSGTEFGMYTAAGSKSDMEVVELVDIKKQECAS